jgi:peptidoglycan hydrolase-like protein with peptidoglycan-binding domain
MTTTLSNGRGWLQDDAAASIARMDKAFGRAIPTNSTGRTYAQQAEAYRKYLNGGPLALKPGTSIHEKGRAVDFANSAYSWLGSYSGVGWRNTRANGFGWVRTVPSELWHYEYNLYKDNALVQTLLNKVGYKLTVDGIKGRATTAALKAFQKKHGLKADGVFGAVTHSKFKQVIAAQTEKPKAPTFSKAYYKGIQTKLNKLGYKLTADGINGPKTIAAVKAFQKKYKLTADGIPGAKTNAKLDALIKALPSPGVKRTTKAPVNGRDKPTTKSKKTTPLAKGKSYYFDAWTYGEKVSGNNVWFRGKSSKNWYWSGGFTSKSTAGMKKV